MLGVCGLGGDYRAQVRDWINQARAEAADVAKLYVRSGLTLTIPTPASDPADYSLAALGVTGVTGVEEIVSSVDDQVNRLEPVTLAEMLAYRASLSVPTTSEPAAFYTLRGGDTLMLHPGADAGSTLTLYGTFTPPLLSDDADVPSELPDRFHATLMYGAARQACLVKQPGLYAQFDAAWQQGFGRLRAWSTDRLSGGPTHVRIGRRIASIPSSNLVDRGD